MCLSGMHLNKRVCPSVGQSACPSICLSINPSIGHHCLIRLVALLPLPIRTWHWCCEFALFSFSLLSFSLFLLCPIGHLITKLCWDFFHANASTQFRLILLSPAPAQGHVNISLISSLLSLILMVYHLWDWCVSCMKKGKKVIRNNTS